MHNNTEETGKTPQRSKDAGEKSSTPEGDRDDAGRRPEEEALRTPVQEWRQRESELAALLEGSRAVLQYRDFKSAASAIFDTCKRLIGATAGYVALLTEDGTENDVLFLDPGGEACLVDPTLPMPVRGLREQAYHTGQTVYENDFVSSEWAEFLPPGHARIGNVLFAPLLIKGIAVGLLGLANKPGAFTEDDARMAAVFGELAAVALFNSRALESLQSSEERFRAVAQSASDAIITFDSRGVIVFWNKAAEKIFGYAPDEAVGKPLGFIIPERFRAAHGEVVERLVSAENTAILGKGVEMVGLRRDGCEFPIELSLSTWKIKEDVFFSGIIRDITERVRAQEEIKSLARFPDENRNPVMRVLHDGTVRYANTASAPLLAAWDTQVGQKLPDQWRQRITDRVSDEQSHTIEVVCVDRIYSVDLAPKDGTDYINLYARDVTERRRAEQLLRDQNQFVMSAIESLAHPFYVIDATDYTVKIANSAAYQGDSSGALTCYALTHARHTPCSDDGYSCPLDEIKKTGRAVVTEHIHYDVQDRRAIHEVHAYPIFDVAGHVTQIIEYTLDITERKETEEALRETTQLLEAILEHTPTLMAYLDPQFNFIRVNRAYAQADQREPSFFPGKNHFDLYPNAENEAIFRRVVETGDPFFIYAKPFEYAEHPEWGVSYWDWSLVPLKEPGGTVTELVLTLADVTERVEAELALQRERDFTAAVLDTASALVVVLDPQGRIVRFNRACENLTGYTSDEVQGRPFWEMFLIPEELEPVKAVFAQLQAGQFPSQYENYWLTKDGGRRLIAWSNTTLLDAAGSVEHVIGTGIDITEGRRAQEALQEAHNQLERRVQERTAELARANAELRAEIVHRSQVEKQLRLQSALAESLVHVTLALNSSLDLDEVLDRILAQAQRVIPCCAAAVMLIQDSTVQVSRYRGLDDFSQAWDALETGFALDAFSALKAVSTSQRPVLIADASRDPAWQFPPGFEWVRSFVAVPLLHTGEEISGFLAVFSDEPDVFDPQMTDLLQAFAVHAVTAIRNAERYAAELQARRTAEILSAASLALTQTLDLDTVLDTLLDYLQRLVPFDSANVILPQDENSLAVRAVRGYEGWTEPQEILGLTVRTDSNPHIDQLLATHKSLLIPDTRRHPAWQHHVGGEHVRSWLGIPIIADEQVIGICGLEKNTAGFFTQHHVGQAEALVGQAAVAVQNSWLFRQVRAGRERMQSLSRRLVEAQESERRYVARELHDEAGQALTSLKVGLRLLEREAQHPAAVVAGVSKLMDVADGVLEDLHRLAMNLRPASLDHLGLVAALHQYAQAVSDQSGLVVQFEAVGTIERLSSELEITLYRAVQEALTNVIRHAKATRVDLLLKRRGDELIVLVEDNGVGFDPTAETPSGRLGLIGLRERAEMVGGRLTVESTADAGTTLLLEVPYVDANTHR